MAGDFDPLAPETFDSPQLEYARLRAECPVARSEAWGGFWALMKHADVVHAASESQTFITSVQNVVPKVAFTGRRPPLHLDPPEHTPYRRALAPLFSEKRVAALEPEVRGIARDLLRPLVAAGKCDVVEDFSSPLPVAVFSRWMNLESENSGGAHRRRQALQHRRSVERRGRNPLLQPQALRDGARHRCRAYGAAASDRERSHQCPACGTPGR